MVKNFPVGSILYYDMICHVVLPGIRVVTALISQFFWKYTLLCLDITVSILPKSHEEFVFITLVN